ncbi:toprim domain-containing protein [Candidatus Rariloculus sp.]|uniref:toprim domain-containing protein n=1 Tax=Candidatus Rariloculus sp. TaxID=3101265 RepID=UPI003D14C8F7
MRFSSPGQTACSTLLVGEGIETVLSLVTALRGAALPETVAAAALSAGSLGAFVPPPGVSRLLIAQDRDAEGQRAALRLQLRCTRLGIGSTVIVPDGGDFNDDLRALGTERLAQRLAMLATLATPHRASNRTAAPMRKE